MEHPIIKSEGDFEMESCFMCRQLYISKSNCLPNDTCSNPVNGELNQNINLSSLHYILRYLKLAQSSPSASSSVSMCESCMSISTKLKTLCLELEAIQMQVNHQLKEFYEVIHENSPRKKYDKPEKMGTLRGRIISACQQKLSDLNFEQPVVQLARMDEHNGIHKRREISGTTKDNSVILARHSTNETYLQTGNLVARKYTTHYHISAGKYKVSLAQYDARKWECDLCYAVLKMKHSLKHHKMVVHMEEFFPGHKLPHISDQDFIKYCKRVMSNEILRGTNMQANEKSLRCPECPQSISSSFSLQCHLILIHYNVVSEKLKRLQETMKPEELTITVDISKRSNYFAQSFVNLPSQQSGIDVGGKEGFNYCDEPLTSSFAFNEATDTNYFEESEAKASVERFSEGDMNWDSMDYDDEEEVDTTILQRHEMKIVPNYEPMSVKIEDDSNLIMPDDPDSM